MPAGLTLAWARSQAEREVAARFFARIIARDPAYISHGEIQQALSPDGAAWAPDLEARLLREFSGDGESSAVALARAEGALVGAASVQWEADAPAPHATLADLAVEPDRRSARVGAALVNFIEAEARARGLGWMFLESGLQNHRAHDFFGREGFRVVSKVFAKRL